MLQRVKYVTPHVLKNKNIKSRLLKWYLNNSNWRNSHAICKNSLIPADTDVCKSNLGSLWCHLRYILITPYQIIDSLLYSFYL